MPLNVSQILSLMREAPTSIFGPIRPPIGATEPFQCEKNKTFSAREKCCASGRWKVSSWCMYGVKVWWKSIHSLGRKSVVEILKKNYRPEAQHFRPIFPGGITFCFFRIKRALWSQWVVGSLQKAGWELPSLGATFDPLLEAFRAWAIFTILSGYCLWL